MNYHDSNQFAIKVGELLSEVFQENLSADQLPNGRMYYNIARKVVDPMMNQNYQLVSENSSRVQEILNKQAGLHIKAQKPKLNQGRIDGIVQRLADSEQFDDIKWILKEPIINFSQSVIDDAIKANADFQHQAGLKPKIIRTANAGCCEWCSRVVGEYDYSKNMPKDVFRRHRNCRCETNYHPGDGKKQDVWSKKWQKVDEDDKIRKRKELSNKPRVIHKGEIKTKDFVRGSGKNYPVRFIGSDHVKFASDTINKAVVIAGENVRSKLRIAKRLENHYREPERRWEKLSGETFIFSKGKKIKIEMHWYEANGKRYELKVKRVISDES